MNHLSNVLTQQRHLTPSIFGAAAVANAAGNLWMDLAGASHSTLANATKVLLMPLLALYLFAATRQQPARADVQPRLLYWALAFGWLGDVLLMLPERLSSALPLGAFIWGMAAFLLGHLVYSRILLRGLSLAELFQPVRLLFALPLGVYGYVLFLALRDFLGPMTLPVVVYMAALLANGFFAYSRWMAHPEKSSAHGMLGALLFVQSDSILAVNRFLFVDRTSHSMPLANFMIMATYVLAQFWLVRGTALDALTTRERQEGLAPLPLPASSPAL